MKKFLEIIKNKWLIKGTTTLLLVLIVIACYIGLNMLVEKVNVENLDFTEKKLYSLSDETKTKLSDLNQDVTIQLINATNYRYLIDYAKKYTILNDRIKVEEISDLSSRVDLKTKYNLSDTDMLIVIKEGEKEKTLTSNDLSTYDYSTNKQIDLTEEAITNAIVELSMDKKPVIYVLSSKSYYQSEQALSSVTQKLQDESNEVKYLDILTSGSVPEDCNCLVITTLKEDLNELERDKILEYIKNGGKILMLTSQNVLNVETPNLNAILAEYGISINFGAVFEQDTSKMLQNAPEFVITDVSSSFMSNINMAMKMCFVDAGSIQFQDSDKLNELGVTYETIASTGSTSFIRTNFDIQSYSRTEQDSEEGSFIVGADVTKKISDDISSELVIYSSEVSAMDLQIPVSSQYYMYAVDLYNNKDIILNSVSHLTERNNTITIRKDDDSETYTVTAQQDSIIKMIIFIVPVVIIILGVIVWIIRKRRK